YKQGGWEYHVFRRWLEAGAKFEEDQVQKLVNLEVTPAEILFAAPGEKINLKAVAVWPDGTREDVTCLCRFTSNSDQVATIDADGLVTATEPGDTHVVVSYDNAVIAIPVIRPVTQLTGSKYPEVATPTKIDELVVQKLRKLGVVPSDLASDSEFLRRVYLDVTGTLPTSAEVEAFLADTSANKRAATIDRLLETPAYAAWWTTKFCDYTGNNDTKLNNLGPRGQISQWWYDWIYERIEQNQPYDKIAEGLVLASSREKDESYTEFCEAMSKISQKDSDEKFADRETMPYYWARNNFRQPEERAIGFAYTFLGIRIQCAQCHKHPFDQWSKKDFDAFKNFFTGVTLSQNTPRDKESREEYDKIMKELGLDSSLRNNELRNKLYAMLNEGKTIPFPEVTVTPPRQAPNRGNNRRNNQPPAQTAAVLGGEQVDTQGLSDIRQPLMDWLRQKDNPYFARAFVNRVWAGYFNVGIVQPPDDMSLANPPSNRPLLDYLAAQFIEHGYDLKWLHREILNSRTYQLTWQPNETNAKDERNFARSVPRRMPAEVAVDALAAAVASDEKAAGYLTSLEGRAIAIAGSSARSNAGANARDSGFALQVFGRSIRESNCDCDRSMDASLLQTVYLQNDTSVLNALEGGRDSWIGQLTKATPDRLTDGTRTDNVNLDREIARMKDRLKRAKDDGNDEQVKRIEDRLAELQKASGAKQEAEKSPGKLALAEPELVRLAYLRTVSRLPSQDEMDRCLAYLAEADSPAAGAKGLLWSLINTKEFIVNH
ncbi:MAG TPA: DUF1549 and DUF1553 domain-containing protein, partial [Pirellulaceae bacterium]|nr:DUF1549 and DUF1553 domain-containing protein [Pirellulaceae bacterium]